MSNNTDCDDTQNHVNPGGKKSDANDDDEDCDGATDDNDPDGTPSTTTYYIDGDLDGWGSDSDTGTNYCDPPATL